MLSPGVHTIPLDAYLAEPALSSSMARDLLTLTPKACRWKWDNPQRETAQMDLGKLAHQWLLEGDAELAGWAVLPEDHDGRTKAGKDRIAGIEADGLKPLKWEQHETVKAMVAAARSHPLVIALLEDCEPERTLIWVDPETGVRCKARLDGLPRTKRYFPELKTTSRGLDDESLERTIETYRYGQQLRWYEEGVEALKLFDQPQGVHIFQETPGPYDLRLVELKANLRARSRVENAEARHRYAACLAAGEWPGWAPEVTSIGMPAWAEKRWTERDLADWQAPILTAAE